MRRDARLLAMLCFACGCTTPSPPIPARPTDLPEPSTPRDSPPGDDAVDGICDVEVTGSLKARLHGDRRRDDIRFGPGFTSFLTDYWKTDEELEVDRRRHGLPSLLDLFCFDADRGFTVNATLESRRADVPLRAKRYAIGTGRGQMMAEFFDHRRDEPRQFDAASGYVEITSFDTSKIVGTFELSASTMTSASSIFAIPEHGVARPRRALPIFLRGRFEFSCSGSARCSTPTGRPRP
jgi:hypothetical protein